MRRKQAVVAVFAKAPIPGKVKTRLIPYISAEAAAELQLELLHDRLQMACSIDGVDVQLWCGDGASHPAFRACRQQYPLSLHEQIGIDLGERMMHAFGKMLERYRVAAIIGTDAPVLDAADVKAAMQAAVDHDFVLTPAEDGGYVLIGTKRHMPDVFNGVEWGKGRVLAKTCENLDALGYAYALMDERWDVDRPEDLERYRCLRNNGQTGRHGELP